MIRYSLKIKLISALGLITILFLQVTGIDASNETIIPLPVYAQSDSEFLQYENSDMGVKMDYPSNWNFEETPGPTPSTAFFAPFENDSDEYSENLTITVEHIGVKLLPQYYADLTIESIKSFIPDLEVISSSPTRISGEHFQKIIFEIPNMRGLEIKGMMMSTTVDDNMIGYSILYFAEKQSFDSYLPLVNKSIDSFKISEIKDKPVEIEAFSISEYLVYENSSQGIAIKYPPNWQKVEPEGSPGIEAIFQSPLESASDKFAENSLLIIGDNPRMSLEDYTQVSINNFESRPTGIVIEEDSSTLLGGLPAHQIIYTETSESGVKVKGWMVWTIANNLVYTVGFGSDPESFDSYKQIFQNMINSVEIEEIDLPTPISGKYSNSQVGLEIQFPEGWKGIEQQKEDVAMIIVSPGITIQPFTQGSQMSDKLEFSVITIVIGKFSSVKEQISSEISEDMECTSQTVQVIELNSMKTQESIANCQDPKMGTIKGLDYMFTTKDDTIIVSYGAISTTPDKKYDEHIEQFKESLKTLKIQNTLDISDPFAYAKTLEMTASKESVMLDGQNLDVLFASNSNISNFSFDEENNFLTFEPKGQTGTSGMTEVYLGNILEEPYSVSLGNNQIDDFTVVHDTTNGQTSIFFEYEHPTGLVTVTNQIKKTTEIPDWIRNNASWWVEGNIDDEAFVGGIQFLIKEGVIQIPETAKPITPSGPQEIPAWIKNNADWWSQGLISDGDFLKGITFLVENGIIIV